LAVQALLVDQAQPDGVGELELAAVLGEVGAQAEHARLRIEAADHGGARGIARRELDADVEVVAQGAQELVARRLLADGRLAAERVRALLEEREVVAVRLEEVRDLVEGARSEEHTSELQSRENL